MALQQSKWKTASVAPAVKCAPAPALLSFSTLCLYLFILPFPIFPLFHAFPILGTDFRAFEWTSIALFSVSSHFPLARAVYTTAYTFTVSVMWRWWLCVLHRNRKIGMEFISIRFDSNRFRWEAEAVCACRSSLARRNFLRISSSEAKVRRSPCSPDAHFSQLRWARYFLTET